ncbi:MAG TPA: hypothetical protein PLD93_02365, partial [Synergistaceae bacterium]|nr:hypothetical protein [Synergistaceae bacterium]
MSEVPQEMMTVSSKFSTDTFRILVDHKELVTEMFRTLTGYELKWSTEGSPVLVEGEYKMMNRKGALHFFHFIRQSVNPITSLTDWDEERANRHLQNRMLNFNLSLYNNYDRWDIDEFALSDISTGMCELI